MTWKEIIRRRLVRVGEALLGPQSERPPSGGQDTSDSLERQSEWGTES